ncbi:MAG: SGNH/GDSL hydrolase family protein [Isosphaeraceae bacterium]|nr:SGNH/GDSL hydrolase family protein [Isosphaeraceae bacterium]
MRRHPSERQRLFPFRERSERRDRYFKRAIFALTVLVIVAMLAGSPAGRYAVGSLADRAREAAYHQLGLVPSDEEIDAARQRVRERTIAQTRRSLVNFYDHETTPEMRHLFDVAGMNPETGLVATGRPSNGFLLSSRVFEPDDHGRSYRLRPRVRSIWLRQITLRNGPFGLFLVPDTPEVRTAAAAVGAIVDEPSKQTTNSWGLRGPEPDPSATVRGIILGDSFMQGMFNGDDDTPPLSLERYLCDAWQVPVSILNTGHIGYAPEQYYFTLREYGERFPPHFVIVSVCPNDFGEEMDVLQGRGGDWDEARLWLGRIVQWCRSRNVPCLLVPVPCFPQILGVRRDAHYPARISHLWEGSSLHYCDPLNAFVDEHLRLAREARRRGEPSGSSRLYNLHIADNHFSPLGAALWAREVGRRVTLLVNPPEKGTEDPSPALPSPDAR